MAEKRSYELNREMIALLAAEFDPARAVESFAGALKGAGEGGAGKAAGEVFGDYGRRWAARTVELGEKYTDRTYEILREADGKTGRLAFPHILQRFVEIGYLATQPMEHLRIIINNYYDLVYRVEECSTHGALAAACGAGLAGEAPCRHACTAFAEEVIRLLGMNAEFRAEALRSPEGYCQFRATNRSAR